MTETFVTPFLESPFSSVAAILLMAALLGGLALWLRQPLIVAFVAVGVLVGPAGFGWVVASDEIELLAKIGIAILLGLACLLFGAAANFLWLAVGFAALRFVGQGSLMLGCANIVPCESNRAASQGRVWRWCQDKRGG